MMRSQQSPWLPGGGGGGGCMTYFILFRRSCWRISDRRNQWNALKLYTMMSPEPDLNLSLSGTLPGKREPYRLLDSNKQFEDSLEYYDVGQGDFLVLHNRIYSCFFLAYVSRNSVARYTVIEGKTSRLLQENH